MEKLSEIKALGKAILSPEDIAGILGSSPQTIRVTARQHPELIGYPFTFTGDRMKIPCVPFLRFMGEEV